MQPVKVNARVVIIPGVVSYLDGEEYQEAREETAEQIKAVIKKVDKGGLFGPEDWAESILIEHEMICPHCYSPWEDAYYREGPVCCEAAADEWEKEKAAKESNA